MEIFDRLEAGATTVSGSWRWWVHLALLTIYPSLAFYRALGHSDAETAVLPASIRGLLLLGALQMSLMAVLLAGAWAFSRFRPYDLWMRNWRGGRTVLQGLGYSVLLRLLLAMVSMVLGTVVLMLGVKQKALEEFLRHNGPHTDALVQSAALKDPLYLLLMTTFISFGVAALCEEAWRAGSMAAWTRLLPASLSQRDKTYWALGLSAVIFGLGHLTQGPIAMGGAALLGVALGAIMLRTDSIWPAVMAHGFFDASTFLAMAYAVNHNLKM